MVNRRALILSVVLLAASCSNGDSSAGTLLTDARPATTSPVASTTTPAAPSPTTTTTVAPTTTTSVATTTSSVTTTTTAVEVAAGGTDDGGTLVQLPFTGSEPGVAAAAAMALMLGAWLLRWSWRERSVLIHAVLWHRAPIGDWPPDAVNAVTVNDRRFRRAARREARRHGIDFVDGVDAYATRWARRHGSVDDIDPAGLGWLADWQRAMVRVARRIYG